jgi:hypothetical protein
MGQPQPAAEALLARVRTLELQAAWCLRGLAALGVLVYDEAKRVRAGFGVSRGGQQVVLLDGQGRPLFLQPDDKRDGGKVAGGKP